MKILQKVLGGGLFWFTVVFSNIWFMEQWGCQSRMESSAPIPVNSHPGCRIELILWANSGIHLIIVADSVGDSGLEHPWWNYTWVLSTHRNLQLYDNHFVNIHWNCPQWKQFFFIQKCTKCRLAAGFCPQSHPLGELKRLSRTLLWPEEGWK